MAHSEETKARKIRIGKNIKAEMRKRGLNQTQLARRYGCSRQYIHSMINEGTVVEANIEKVASILGCQPSTLTK
jgi:transcriptional regulator with XRE-family HTH domain